MRNKTQTLIYTAKKDVFQSKLATENKDSKSLKDLHMPSKKGKASSVNNVLNFDGEAYFDKGVVAEKFNSFYTTVAAKLVEKLPKV